jgi:hypothetical protein
VTANVSSGVPAARPVALTGTRRRARGGPGAAVGLTDGHRVVPFDADVVVHDLRARRHPNAEFMEAILTGKRQRIQAPAAG